MAPAEVTPHDPGRGPKGPEDTLDNGAEHMRRWRAKRPDLAQRHKQRQLARDRALRALARLRPKEMELLYHHELRKAGLV